MDWDALNKLLTPDGQTEFVELCLECKKMQGEKWLDDVREFSPTLCEVADAVFNHDFEDAFPLVCKQFPPALMMKAQLREIHIFLNAEFNKPRI